MATAATLLLSNLTEVDKTFYVDKFLTSYKEEVQLYNHGQAQDNVTIDAGGGTTANWARIHPFSLVTSAGSEGLKITTFDQIRAMSLTAQVEVWYKAIEVSDVTWAQGRNGTMPAATAALGQNAGESLEYGTASIVADTAIYPLPANAYSETTKAWNALYYQERIAATTTGSTTTIGSSNIALYHSTVSDDVLIGGWVCITKGRGYGYGGRITAHDSDGLGSGVPKITVSPTMPEITDAETADCTYFSIAHPNPGTGGVQLKAQHMLTTSMLRKAHEILTQNKAPKFEDGLYHCILHPQLVTQLMQDTTWTNQMQYQKAEKGERNVIGIWGGFKFYTSTMAPRFGATVQTRNDFSYTTGTMRMTICLGRGAFGIVKIGGKYAGSKEPQMIYNPPTSGGVANPAEMYGTMAWKYWWKVKGLNANWAVGIMTYL